VLYEWAEDSHKTLAIEERLLPVLAEIGGVCELLGADPIHVANEGAIVVAVPEGLACRAIDVLNRVPETVQAVAIGRVESRELGAVVVERGTRQKVPLDEPVGAPLPRICYSRCVHAQLP
jgi:hydrogenase expression/formation protein HypE